VSVAVIRAYLRREHGATSVELVGLMPVLILAALAGWQVLLFGFTATAAENAARTGSRAESRGKDGQEAARESVSRFLQDGTKATIDGTKATVRIEVPIIFPLLSSEDLTVSGSAEMPDTGS
jgi:Flp pilus assembly pilin Flp